MPADISVKNNIAAWLADARAQLEFVRSESFLFEGAGLLETVLSVTVENIERLSNGTPNLVTSPEQALNPFVWLRSRVKS